MIESAAKRCPRVAPAQTRHQRTRHEVLLYHVPTDTVFETNEIGLEIIQQLDGRHTCLHLANGLAARYGLSLEAMLGDVSDFLQALDTYGIVEWV